jgi:hypothetical protein
MGKPYRAHLLSREYNHHVYTKASGDEASLVAITVWECFSFNCKLDLHVLQGNLSDVAYRDNALSSHVVPHFDNHPLDHITRQFMRLTHFTANKVPYVFG